MSVTFQDIEKARTTLKGNVVRTPLIRAAKLSDITGADIFVKFENLQVTSSFKDRGAYNKMSSLTSAEKARGVIAMSAGNHAQAVAYHAKRLAIPATIVMPETTPSTKIERTRAHGANVILSGETLADSLRLRSLPGLLGRLGRARVAVEACRRQSQRRPVFGERRSRLPQLHQ